MGANYTKRWLFCKFLAKPLDIKNRMDYNSDSISMPT